MNRRSLVLLCSFGLWLAACHEMRREDTASRLALIDNSLVGLDLLARGPYKVEEGSYEEAPTVDAEILPAIAMPEPKDLAIDFRGEIYLPTGAKGPRPLILLMAGRHATCGFVVGDTQARLDFDLETFAATGACKDGLVEAPSHLGYAYLAHHLASRGYAVVSINSNRGIPLDPKDNTVFDAARVQARGVLVLKTLEKLQAWADANHATPALKNVDLRGRLDFAQVGLMGHSRGGEGVRAAQNLWADAASDNVWRTRLKDVQIRSVLEVGPIDASLKDDVKYTPKDVPWAVIIPGCDGDVASLGGTHPFVRAIRDNADGLPKAAVTIWGANHNYFNTEWMVSDAKTCSGRQQPLWDAEAPALSEVMPEIFRQAAMADATKASTANALWNITGSQVQRDTLKALATAFFVGTVGDAPQASLMHVFDPQYRLPAQLSALAPMQREFVGGGKALLVYDAEKAHEVQPFGKLTMESLKDLEANMLERAKDAVTKKYDALGLNIPHTFEIWQEWKTRPALVVEWGAASENEGYVQFPLDSVSLKDFEAIDFRLSAPPRCAMEGDGCTLPSVMDASVQLVDEAGDASDKIPFSRYYPIEDRLRNTYFLAFTTPKEKEISHILVNRSIVFQSLRIELRDFTHLGAKPAKALRILFDRKPSGALAFESISLAKRP